MEQELENVYQNEYYRCRRSKRRGKSLGVNGPHVPNQNEGSALRKLKIDTKMTEEEIRDVKKYRQILSTAQKNKPSQAVLNKKKKEFIKSIKNKLKLPAAHPKVVAQVKIRMEEFELFGK